MARGSIQKRIGKDGRVSWTAIVDLPPVLNPDTGKLQRKQKRITAGTKKEIDAKVAALVTSTTKGVPDATRATVLEFMNYWLETTKPTLKPATHRRYSDLAKNHIVPFIGSLKLARLTPAHVQSLYANRLDAGLSNTTVFHLHSVLHHALDDAVQWEFVFRNVTDAATPPKRDEPEMKTWTQEQADRFLSTSAATEADKLEALWTLALLTGMRRGEILGLRWSDFDKRSSSISVQRSLSRGSSSELIEQAPKTKSGRRRISLPRRAIEKLEEHREAQDAYRASIEPAWEDHNLIFTNELGRHLHPNTLDRLFKLAIARAKVPAIRFHDLRHTAATLLLQEGVHPKIVQERMGHANIAETMKYSHVMPHMQEAATQALERVIPGSKSDVP